MTVTRAELIHATCGACRAGIEWSAQEDGPDPFCYGCGSTDLTDVRSEEAVTVAGRLVPEDARGVQPPLGLWILFGAAGLLLAAPLVVVFLVGFRELLRPVEDLVPGFLPGVAAALGALLLAAALVGVGVRRRRSRCRVIFSQRGVTFVRAGGTDELPWERVTAFDDGSAREVSVHAGPERYAVPVPSEEDRVAVLAVLGERRVPRIEA